MIAPGKVKSFIIKYGLYYSVGLIIILGLKYYYSKAGSDDLGWILAPTAWCVKILSGIPFEKELHVGFINNAYRFIIAPSCSGINFMIITFATLLFSFLHRMGTAGSRFLWIAISLGISYLYTILVNGFRIIFSIYLLGLDIYNGWITPERIHMIEGTVVYFISLFIIYNVVGNAIKYFVLETDKRSYIPPLFWYLSITLGIPVLNSAYRNDGIKFMEHSILIIAVCLAAIILFYLVFLLQKLFGKRIMELTRRKV